MVWDCCTIDVFQEPRALVNFNLVDHHRKFALSKYPASSISYSFFPCTALPSTSLFSSPPSQQAHCHPGPLHLLALCQECPALKSMSHPPSDILLKYHLFYAIFPSAFPISLLCLFFLALTTLERIAYFTYVFHLLSVFSLEYKFHLDRNFPSLYP